MSNVLLYHSKRRSRSEQLPTLSPEKSQSTPAMTEKVSNPMFDQLKSPTASAMGGIPTEIVRSRIPSPKVHPAPQPPIWPNAAVPSRVKKLSWNDDKVVINTVFI